MPKRRRQEDPAVMVVDILRQAAKCRQPVNVESFSNALHEMLEQGSPHWIVQLKEEILNQLEQEGMGRCDTILKSRIECCSMLSSLAQLDNAQLRSYLKQDRAHKISGAFKHLINLVRATFRDDQVFELADLEDCFPQRWTLKAQWRPCILLCGLPTAALGRLMWKPPTCSIPHVENKIIDEQRVADAYYGNRVAVLVGEAGAGKTHALLTANRYGLTVVLDPTSSDFLVDLAAAEDAEKFCSILEAMIAKATLEPMTRMQRSGFGFWRSIVADFKRRSSLTERVHIVLDDVHQFPHCLERLGRWRQSLSNRLVGNGGLFHGLETHNIFFVCAGNGLTLPGGALSYPPCLAFVVEKQVRWMELCTACRFPDEQFRGAMQTLATAASQHHLLRHLEDNARTAIMCFDEFIELAERMLLALGAVCALQATTAVGANAFSIFSKVAEAFCGTLDIGRLGSKTTTDVSVSEAALRLILCRKSSKNVPPAELVHRFGVVGDVMVDYMCEGYVPDDFQTVGSTTEGLWQCVPKTGRHWMSRAMSIILASCVNKSLENMAVEIGDVLGSYVALKVFLAAASTASRGEFFQFLALDGPGGQAPRDALFRFTQLISKKLAGHYREDGFNMDLFAGYLKAVHEKDTAYLFTNGGFGFYADVFFVARGVVVLFLLKDNVIDYSARELKQELSELGLMPGEESGTSALQATQLLCDAAGIDRSDVVFTRVLRRGFKGFEHQEVAQLAAGTKYINLCAPSTTSARDLMYPLLWPPVSERCPYGVVECVSPAGCRENMADWSVDADG